MAITYEPIATTTLGSAVGSYTFSSISGSYTDLIIIGSAKNTGTSNTDVLMRFNSDTGSNYSTTRLYGSGTSASSDRQTSQTSIFSVGYIGGSNTSSVFGIFKINIMNYSNSTTYKTTLSSYNSQGTSDQYVLTEVGLWRSTSAITSITLLTNSNNFDTGSTFSLYGIKSA